MELLKGTQAIEKAIISIQNRGGKLDDSIQFAGLSVLAHIDQHSDVTLADRLFKAMPKGSRALAIVAWLEMFGKVRAIRKGDEGATEALKAGRVFWFDKTKNTDMAGATDTPWHSLKKEKAPSEEYDVTAAVKRILARINSEAAKGTTIKGGDIAESLAKLVA